MLFYKLKYQASERLHEKFTNFVSKNKAAQIQQSGRFALTPFSLLYGKFWPFHEMPVQTKVLAFTVVSSFIVFNFNAFKRYLHMWNFLIDRIIE